MRFKPGDKRYRVNIAADRHCARCKAEAKRDGYMGMRHGDGRSSDRKMRLMPDVEASHHNRVGHAPSARDTYAMIASAWRMHRATPILMHGIMTTTA